MLEWGFFSCLGLLGFQSGLHAETLKAQYGMTLMGLSIGSAYANGFIEPRSYRLDIGMRTTGLANLVNSAKGVASASGGMSLNGPSPASYANTTSNSEETRTIRMSLSSNAVRSVEIRPEPWDLPATRTTIALQRWLNSSIPPPFCTTTWSTNPNCGAVEAPPTLLSAIRLPFWWVISSTPGRFR